jgi:hypothetical protein
MNLDESYEAAKRKEFMETVDKIYIPNAEIAFDPEMPPGFFRVYCGGKPKDIPYDQPYDCGSGV